MGDYDYKKAKDILTQLGFSQEGTNRGWVLNRTSNILPNKPVRLHALIHTDDDRVEYIDLHEDYADGSRHITKRRHRVKRLNMFFYEVDNDLDLSIGHKMRRHYIGLREAEKQYETRHSPF